MAATVVVANTQTQAIVLLHVPIVVLCIAVCSYVYLYYAFMYHVRNMRMV